METNEANIKVTRSGDKISSISVSMPIWTKNSEQGNLIIKLPLLGIETISKNEADSEKAIEEALISFCVVSERFGQGIESELMTLGWTSVKSETGETLLGYNVEDDDSLIERLIQTGDNYTNTNLEIAA